jgi:PD-(D/E)XK nuclease superfamily protein
MKTVAKTQFRTKAQGRAKRQFSFGKGARIMSCKERGEWAELCFMARAAGEGLRVLKPYGEWAAYDVAVERGGPILRVQVKSTIYKRRNEEYSLNVMGPKRKAYPKGSVDYFAIYLIPVNAWYIVPQSAMGKTCTIHFTVHSKRHKYAKYREAWDLLVGENVGKGRGLHVTGRVAWAGKARADSSASLGEPSE